MDDGRMEIIHVDESFVVVVKASGLLAVPGRGEHLRDCVSERVKQRFPGTIEHPAVHRLDMDTSGLMVVARTRSAQRELSRQFQQRETSKRYIAILDGLLDQSSGAPSVPASGTIELPTRLDVDNRPIQIVDPEHGKWGTTHWCVLGTCEGRTRIEFRPITGRTHQLRIHAAHPEGLGIAIVGDPFYGSGSGPGELLLHACELGFAHPHSGDPLRFTSSPPF